METLDGVKGQSDARLVVSSDPDDSDEAHDSQSRVGCDLKFRRTRAAKRAHIYIRYNIIYIYMYGIRYIYIYM